MYFLIAPMFERGVHRDWKDIRRAERVTGDIQIQDCPFNPMKRTSLTARILGSGPLSDDQIPPLYDVQMDGMATLGFVLKGFEIIDGVMYRQAWHCKDDPRTVRMIEVAISELGSLI
ncbi:hypothetical protein [Pseudomonas sp. RIT-PI-S]|uniref:hypothetical protein n=1 Tax=Pseudomonas sp. RIT-PI-S TaxID=3035295 RepID=UPI0021D85BE8|nr:hypothetical protein [Pseudomonas sp. RIT-PI-S]